jgi:hypothetical protein
MRVIIAGSRSLDENEPYYLRLLESLVTKFIDQYGEITEVVSGTARGADLLGEKWANENRVKIARFPADWKKNGKAAGPIRNTQMGQYADGAIIIWDGKSPGSKHMRDVMVFLDKPFILDIFEIIHYNYEHKPDGTIEQFMGRKPPTGL